MQSSKLIIPIGAINTNSISPSRISLSGFGMLSLILLDLLRRTLALIIELLILSLDLGLAMFGVGAAAAGTVLSY